MIEIKNLNKTFNKNNKKVKDFEALKKINLEVNDGEVIALLGSNGSGKSTLLKIISGIIKPTEGQVRIDGDEIFKNRKKCSSIWGLYSAKRAHLFQILRFRITYCIMVLCMR